jgi:hypothetical protein
LVSSTRVSDISDFVNIVDIARNVKHVNINIIIIIIPCLVALNIQAMPDVEASVVETNGFLEFGCARTSVSCSNAGRHICDPIEYCVCFQKGP